MINFIISYVPPFLLVALWLSPIAMILGGVHTMVEWYWKEGRYNR